MGKLRKTATLIAALTLCSLAPVSAHASEVASRATCYSSRDIPDPDAMLSTIGRLDWSADPNGCNPQGDAFRVCDTNADGYGVAAKMLEHDRYVTTEGHSAGYCTPWKAGNLPEGVKVTIRVWKARGLGGIYVNDYTVTP